MQLSSLLPNPEDWSHAGDWYDRNHDTFTPKSQAISVNHLIERFTHGLASGARVLDAGCGAGRDSLWLFNRGFDVSAFDISEKMVSATRALTGGKVSLRHMGFAEFADPPDSWDAIWAMASLLHVPKAQVGDVITNLVASLAPGGRFFFCVKLGEGERFDALGRPMSFYSQAEICDITWTAARLPVRIETFVEKGSSSLGETQWINLMLFRQDQ